MRDTGYFTLWNVECIFVEESDGIIIIPKDKDHIQDLYKHFDDQNFIIEYCGDTGLKCTAFVERVDFAPGNCIKLFTKYLVYDFNNYSFDGFEITGESIDDFFSPSRYFYDRSKVGVETSVDLIYHNEVAEEWVVIFEGNPVTIALSYGDILRWGVASDLMLHPKLKISFVRTADIKYIYRMYLLIVRFLKIIRYDTECGMFRIDLFSKDKEAMSYNGRLHDFCLNQAKPLKRYNHVNYGNFKRYIQLFLQFAADNPNYSFYHYPSNGIRFSGMDYSPIDFINIFRAFEAECRLRRDTYEITDATKVQAIKDVLISQINNYLKDDFMKEETDFLINAKNRIEQLGTQFGQKTKIVNAYMVLHNALDGSIDHIFIRPELCLKGPLQESDIKYVASFLSSKRGTIVHGEFSEVFSDVDAQNIRFLEILTYSQLLKRVGLEDADIERVIGALFGCNYVLFEERFK